MLSFIFILLIMGCFASCSGKLEIDESPEGWKSLIADHISRYSEMGVKDLYKLVYQGTLGPSHLGTDLSIIKEYLDIELERIEADSSTELIEKISPSGDYVRINLKRFKAKSGNVDILSKAIMLSSRNVKGDLNMMKERWNMICEMIGEHELQFFLMDEIKRFTESVKSNNFPAIHHSEEYRKAYSPAYRVLLKSEWDKISDVVFK